LITQNETVLRLLKRQTLTMRDAWIYGIGRLSARVYELRKQGHNIEAKLKRVKTQFGHANIAVYSLRRK